MSEKSQRRLTVLTGLAAIAAVAAVGVQFLNADAPSEQDRRVLITLSHACADLQSRNIELRDRLTQLEIELHPERATDVVRCYQR